MEVITTINEMISRSQSFRKDGLSIGFVPTMGALHDGHIALVREAKLKNNKVVCSIFVNPIQFNNPEDLKKYPRTIEKDLEWLQKVECDVVFYPDEKEMYPKKETHVYDFGILDKVMEGKYRQGHFNGVAIVVKKLFEAVLPHRAYFGQKDFQQLAIIRALVAMEKLPVEVVSCATIRESDGLAMSSRNARLTAEQRQNAPYIYAVLQQAATDLEHKGVKKVKNWVETQIHDNPYMELEYFEVSDCQSLAPVMEIQSKQCLVACIAVYMGEVRLIDNVLINL